MKWCLVELTYVPGRVGPVRARHRNYLADLARQGRLGLAGRSDDDSGSVFLYGAETQEEPRELMDNDPYIREGVVADRTVRAFVPGVAYAFTPEDHLPPERALAAGRSVSPCPPFCSDG